MLFPCYSGGAFADRDTQPLVTAIAAGSDYTALLQLHYNNSNEKNPKYHEKGKLIISLLHNCVEHLTLQLQVFNCYY